MFVSFNPRAIGIRMSAVDTITLAEEAGFDGVDLLVRDLLQEGVSPAELRDLMDDLDLRPGAWPLPVAWKGDEGRYQADLESLPEYAHVAAVLGLTRTATWVLPECLPGWNQSETIAWHVDRLRPIATILADHGISLGLEAIGVQSFRPGVGERFITKLAEIPIKLAELWDSHPNIGLLVDLFHAYAADESIDEIVPLGPARIVWVHVADLPAGADGNHAAIQDAERGLPGDCGAVPILGGLATLNLHGYQGPVTVEPLAKCKTIIGLTALEAAIKTRLSLKAF